jgi:hypothetical protein
VGNHDYRSISDHTGGIGGSTTDVASAEVLFDEELDMVQRYEVLMKVR